MASIPDALPIRALTPDDVEAFRALRLEALSSSPQAFGSSYEEEAALSLDVFRARMLAPAPHIVFAAIAEDGALAGAAAFLARPGVGAA